VFLIKKVSKVKTRQLTPKLTTDYLHTRRENSFEEALAYCCIN